MYCLLLDSTTSNRVQPATQISPEDKSWVTQSVFCLFSDKYMSSHQSSFIQVSADKCSTWLKWLIYGDVCPVNSRCMSSKPKTTFWLVFNWWREQDTHSLYANLSFNWCWTGCRGCGGCLARVVFNSVHPRKDGWQSKDRSPHSIYQNQTTYLGMVAPVTNEDQSPCCGGG